MSRTYNPYKRTYYDKVKKWLNTTTITVTAVGLAIFYYLAIMGAIQITGHSPDQVCVSDECYVYINFTALKDVYIYPNEKWMFSTDPSIEDITLQRKWGNYWRTINLSKPWSSKVKYAVKFSMGNSYQIRYVIKGKKPWETVKWSFGDIDPYIFGIGKKEDYFRIKKKNRHRNSNFSG